VGIGCGEILDGKVVNAEDKSGGFGAVSPEAWGEMHGFVSVGVQFLDKLIERDDAGFLETVHALLFFDIDVAAMGNRDVVLRVVPPFLGDDGRADSDVLVVAHGGAKVVIFNVKAKVAGAFASIGDGAVDVDLGVQHGDGGGAGIARVIKFVAAGCHVDSMGFFLLGTDGADEICIGHFAPVGDLGLADEENGASAVDAVSQRSCGADAVGE
jgi:hypothetical protein